MASATAHKELSKISLHKRSFMESKMDYEFIKIICGSYSSAKQQIKRDAQKELREKRNA